jgi:acyl-CoA hydrolase
MKSIITHRLVKSEDLNHHKTLFAGRCAEWFVETSFMAPATILNPHHIVCLKVHGFEFMHPIHAGDILTFESKIVANGKSTLTTYCRVYNDKTPEKTFCDGFATFVHVNDDTVPQPHNIVFEPQTEEDIRLNAEAKALILKSKEKK